MKRVVASRPRRRPRPGVVVRLRRARASGCRRAVGAGFVGCGSASAASACRASTGLRRSSCCSSTARSRRRRRLLRGLLLGFFFFSALRAGTVPPTSTPVTAAGAATLIVSAFVPAPAVAVLPPPPELEMRERGAKAATTAMRPMAIVRGSMVLGLYFLARAFMRCVARVLRFGKGACWGESAHPSSLGDLVAGRLEAAQRSGDRLLGAPAPAGRPSCRRPCCPTTPPTASLP